LGEKTICYGVKRVIMDFYIQFIAQTVAQALVGSLIFQLAPPAKAWRTPAPALLLPLALAPLPFALAPFGLLPAAEAPDAPLFALAPLA
jgi:hypothetical protein